MITTCLLAEARMPVGLNHGSPSPYFAQGAILASISPVFSHSLTHILLLTVVWSPHYNCCMSQVCDNVHNILQFLLQ